MATLRLRAWLAEAPRSADVIAPAVVGALVRVAVVAWGAGRFPPTEDGHFYDVLATRLAAGQGYTWRWADGVVTNVAHYPVGYPALVAAAYRVFGPHPGAAMALNAVLGVLAIVAVHRIAASVASRFGAIFAAFALALHPGLVMYTPALMTEGVTAALLAIAGWGVVRGRVTSGRARLAWLVGVGAFVGICALVRGQSLLLAPIFGGLVLARGGEPRPLRRFAKGALAASLVAVLAIAPWTARNCVRMDRCVGISANVGWNLLIGVVEGATGSFTPIAGENVPSECRTVFGEAAKDKCFALAAVRQIGERPGRWLALVPSKLGHTFDYCGAAGWYLNAANPSAFSDSRKLELGIVETVTERLLLLLGLLAVARVSSRGRPARMLVALASTPLLFTPHVWPVWVLVVLLAVAAGRELLEHPPAALGAGAILATALTHAVFFGAGRYSLPVFALGAALAGSAFRSRDPSAAEKTGRF